MKFLLWIVLIGVVLYLLQGKKKPTVAPPAAAAASRRDGAELMVRCEHCDLYLPASEAVSTTSGATYCSQAHRALHPPA